MPATKTHVMAEQPPLFSPGTTAAVTFDDWFFAPDGQQYRVAFGPIMIHRPVDLFGFQPKGSADWFVQIGMGDFAVLLAGCKIHSAMPTEFRPIGSHVYDARGHRDA